MLGRNAVPLKPLILTFLVMAEPAFAGVVWYVKADATGDNTGTSWPNAFTSLDSALAAAQPSDEIWVTQGTYRPTVRTTPADPRTATFFLRDVGLYGGFVGTETARDPRDCDAHATILSGDLAGNDDGTPAKRGENAYQVVNRTSTTGEAVLDGLRITAGEGSGRNGGGVYHTSGRLTLRNCRLINNTANRGAGLYSTQRFTAEACTFSFNKAISAAGAMIYDASILRECTFEENFVSEIGGALDVGYWGQEPTDLTLIERCRFLRNKAMLLGGAIYEGGSNVRVSQCYFEGNTANAPGGAIALYTGFGMLSIDRSTFHRNTSFDQTTEGGGAIMFEGQKLTVSGCTFTENVASRGAAIRMQYSWGVVYNSRFYNNISTDAGGAMFNRMSGVTIANCLMVGNEASNGGSATRNSDSQVRFVNCTILNNRTRRTTSAVFSDSGNGFSVLDLYNSILWGNTNDQGSAEQAQVGRDQYTYCTADHNCVQGWTGLLFPYGYGNTGADPLFAASNPPGRLSAASPCIDAGDDMKVPYDESDVDGDGEIWELLPLDVHGAPRFINTPSTPDVWSPSSVDIGACEYIEDCNKNGLFDACELDCGAQGGPCDVAGCGLAQDCDADGLPDDCEADNDTDGLIDDCDEDDDNDAITDDVDNCRFVANADQADDDGDLVGNTCDTCSRTIAGLPVDETGCPAPVLGDMDRDGDLDQEDFGLFQTCISGPVVPQGRVECQAALLDTDNDVDAADLAIFHACMTVPGMPAREECRK